MQPTLLGVTPHRGERESRLQGQVAQVFTIIWNGEVCVMQRAEDTHARVGFREALSASPQGTRRAFHNVRTRMAYCAKLAQSYGDGLNGQSAEDR